MKKVGLFETDLNIDYYRKKILKNEKKIIKLYPPTKEDGKFTDGDTGLGFNSLTSRFFHFNLLKWFGTTSLKKCIKNNYLRYTNQSDRSIYVQCWANVLRNGENIKPHRHFPHNDEKNLKVSGNIVIYVDTETHTFYEKTPIKNVMGTMVLFPSDLYHWTDTYLGNSERITIAFDIEPNYDEIFDNCNNHWIKI